MPWALRRGPWAGWRNLDRDDGGAAYLRARAAIGVDARRLRAMRWLAMAARPLGLSVGLLAPWLSVLLQWPPAGAQNR